MGAGGRDLQFLHEILLFRLFPSILVLHCARPNLKAAWLTAGRKNLTFARDQGLAGESRETLWVRWDRPWIQAGGLDKAANISGCS